MSSVIAIPLNPARRVTSPAWIRVPALLAAVVLLGTAAGAGAAAAPRVRDLLASKADPALVRDAAAAPRGELGVIVRETVPASTDAETLVGRLGGEVTRDLPIVGGFAARIPGQALEPLAADRDVLKVWGDASLRVKAVDMKKYDDYAPNTVWRGTIGYSRKAVKGMTGRGVTVAVIDTGITKHVDFGDRVLARVDLTPELDGYDRYGHGTHMAGLIAGEGKASAGKYEGLAPAARLVSVKVAGRDGSTDVSVVLAAIQWVVSFKDAYGIRILNLAYGTDSKQSYAIDPLDYAVERAWFAGITVVVAGGNDGPTAGTITKPGDDPFVITVGASDTHDSVKTKEADLAEFTSVGPTPDGFVKPDVLAPGVAMVSVQADGSTIPLNHPKAVLGDNYIRGSGSSQATAVVSGIAALMHEANPAITPDQVKASLVGSAKAIATKPYRLVQADAAVSSATSSGTSKANEGLAPSDGSGSLEASRGSQHVVADPFGTGTFEVIQGEIDVMARSWSARSWSARSWSARSWSADSWGDSGWAGTTQTSSGWEARSWSGATWSGTAWEARSWSGVDWSARSWSGRSWS